MKLVFICVVMGIVFTAPVFAEIVFTVNQSEYYFLVGENAVIPLETNNSYGKPIEGMFSYTYTQEVMQGGMQYSSTNSQTQNARIEEGYNVVNLGFGGANQPQTIKAKLSFNYFEKEEMELTLDEILIHFVAKEEEKKQNDEQKQCSSQSVKEQKQAQDEEQKKQEEEQRKTQEEQKRRESQLSQQEQRLQNSQMPQDSSAIKQQMKDQQEMQKQMEQEFEKSLLKNSEFNKTEQELIDEGYKEKSKSLNPTNNNSGSFEKQYEKDGDTASITGEMKDGKIKDMDVSKSSEQKDMMNKLYNNSEFQKFDKKLKNEGYEPFDMQFEHQKESAQAQVNYQNQENKTATITATFEELNVTEVELEREYEKVDRNEWWLVIIAVLLILAYMLLRKKLAKEGLEESKEKPFDYQEEARKLLMIAEELFDSKEYKDAYSSAAQGVRLYLSYEYGLRREITSDEIIKHLKKIKKPWKEVKECFDLCSLVEFAKYEAKRKDFDKILNLAKGVIG